MPFRSHSAACVSHCCFSLCLRGRGLLVCFYHAAYVPHCRVFPFFSDPGACFSLCLCFLVAVPGACVSFFIRLRTFRIDVFGFSSSRSDLFYFFVVSVCTFRIAAFFVFSGSLGVRFELLCSFAFAPERAIFVFLPSLSPAPSFIALIAIITRMAVAVIITIILLSIMSSRPPSSA